MLYCSTQHKHGRCKKSDCSIHIFKPLSSYYSHWLLPFTDYFTQCLIRLCTHNPCFSFSARLISFCNEMIVEQRQPMKQYWSNFFYHVGQNDKNAVDGNDTPSAHLQNTLSQTSRTVAVHTGTEKVSSIWNSAGLEMSHLTRVDRRLRNIFSRSRFSPVTLDTWKTGHILQDNNHATLNAPVILSGWTPGRQDAAYPTTTTALNDHISLSQNVCTCASQSKDDF